MFYVAGLFLSRLGIYIRDKAGTVLSEFGQAGTDLEGLVRKALDEAYFRWADADALEPLTREHMARQMATALSEAVNRHTSGD